MNAHRRCMVRLCAGLLCVFALASAFGAEQAANPPVAPTVAPAFDHLTTGFELTGQHRDLTCESCHINAVFKGTPRECDACHGVGTAVRATAKPDNHILSSDRCEACHNTVAWSPAVSFDHTEVRGSCSTCHNGVQAEGKGPTHIQTDLECDVCHSTISWTGAVFEHTGITGQCASCHNGVEATGLPSNHIPTTGAACESCHSNTDFVDWLGATMNHSVVTGEPCATCHEAGLGSSFIGVTIVTRPPAPHPTTGDCGQCHNTTSFSGGALMPANHIPLPAADSANCALCHSNTADFSVYAMNHVNITGNCAQCHAAGLSFANIAAPALVEPPSNHIPIGTAACESCHSSTNFTTFAFTNASGTAPPAMVHTAVSGVACATCHASGTSFVGAPATKTPPSNHIPIGTAACESCHTASNFTSFVFTNASGTAPPAMVHSVVASTACSSCHELGKTFVGAPPIVTRPATNHVTTGECSTCHFSTTSFLGASNFPANHIPVPAADGTNCALCHSNTSDYSVYAMNHVNITSNCAQCHAAGLSFTNMAAPALKQPPSNHIPFGSAACESCHTATNFTSFAFTNASGTAPPAMVHSAVAGTACATCHASGLSFVGTPATKTLPSNHVPIGTAACESCHTATNFTSFAFTNASGTAPPAMVHSAVSGVACATCHASGLTFVGTPATKTLPANHVPVGSVACESCHTATNFTSFAFTNASGTAPPAMVHSVVASTACSTCHEAGKTFVGTPAIVTRPATVNGQPHVLTGECSTCHFSTVTFLGASNYPANHIPVPSADSNNCTLCHSNSSDYSVYAMNHVNITSNCAQCHASGLSFTNMAAPTLKQPPSNHIPFGSAACESCHAASNFTSFAFTNASGTVPPAMVHSALAAGTTCATCHAAGLSFVGSPTTKSPPSNHIPFGTAACESCHLSTNYTTFAFTNASGTAPPSMVHSAVSGIVCSTCHEAGKSFVGTPAIVTRPATVNGQPHVQSGECSVCHFSTSSFLGASNYPSNHIPVPTADNNNCALCHSNSNDYSVYAMNHVNITGNCAQCHGAGLSFANMAPPTLKEPPTGTPAHIPVKSNIACELCHSATNFTSFSGTVMRHAAVPGVACETCHEYKMVWYGEPNNWSRPSTSHHAGQDCGGSGCHTSRDVTALNRPKSALAARRPQSLFSTTGTGVAGAVGASPGGTARVSIGLPNSFNHARVTGLSCASCHNGVTASGKPAGHIATSSDCGSCHTTLSWARLAQVDHMQVRGSCASCHDGRIANGKPLTHVTTAADCGVCHTSNAWTPARMDHNAIAVASCRSCHNGVRASGTPAGHVATAQDCNACHGTLSWTPALVDHRTLTARCVSCHNNVAATGLPASHLQTTRDCGTCHVYPSWTPVIYRHVSTAYPGDHRGTLTCESCHTSNSEQVVYAAPSFAGSCAACHARDFKPQAHPKDSRGTAYTVVELRDCTGACHVYSDTTGRIQKSIPGPYHRVTDAAFKH